MSNLDALRKAAEERKAAEAKEEQGPSPHDASKGGFSAAWCGRAGSGQSSADRQAEHDSLMEECAKVDLLALVQGETGETGVRMGERVRFHLNPITGTHDDLDVYPADNTWCSYSESMSGYRRNGKDYAGGNVLDYLEAKHHGDKTAAVRELHELSGMPFDPKRASRAGAAAAGESAQNASKTDGDAPKLLLPPWEHIRAVDPPPRRPVLIPGMLRCGHVGIISGKGKVGKSWLMIGLSISVALGLPWFGLRIEKPGRVIYIDPELDKRSLDGRFHDVCAAMGADAAEVAEKVTKWPLRGVDASIEAITKDLKTRMRLGSFAFGDVSLIVIDTCSCFVKGDENSSVDIRAFSRHVLEAAETTGAAIMLVHHFGKAKDGDRSASDRARGSSVWLDFPDAVLTLTEVYPPSGEPADFLGAGTYACLLESGGLREFPRMEPIPLLFRHPLHELDGEGVTDGWKPKSSQGDGGKITAELNKARAETSSAKLEAQAIAWCWENGVGEEGAPAPGVAEALGLGSDTRRLYKALDGSKYLAVVQVSQRKRMIVPQCLPRPEPSKLDLDAD